MRRAAPLLLGLLTLAIVWGGLSEAAGHAFYAHMTVHMSVVAVAAPLLSLAIAGTSVDPVRKVPVVFSPLVASLVELGVVWIWHMPVLHTAARQSTGALFAEQATFLGSGMFLWLAVFGGKPDQQPHRGAEGIVALLLTAVHMTLLGALLALSPRPLYSHLEGHRGLTALEDQHLGGAIMLLVGGLSYLTGGLWLSVGLLRRQSRTP